MFVIANCSHSDTSESDIENVRENSETDDESDISISVNTEDLSELEFSEMMKAAKSDGVEIQHQ